MANNKKALGLDFGTSSVRVASYLSQPQRSGGSIASLDCVAGRAELVANLDGEHATPSAVSFLDDGSHLIGSAALLKVRKNAARTVTSFHELLLLLGPASAARDAAAAVCAALPFDVAVKDAADASSERFVELTLGERTFDVVDVLARLFARVRADAESAMGSAADFVAIAVPHYFGPAERAATLKAATSTAHDGFKSATVFSAPIATAMHYGLDQPAAVQTRGPAMPSLVLVVHAGGASSNASLVESREGKLVIRASGGGRGGGNAADLAVLRMIAKRAGLPAFPDASGVSAAEGAEPLALQQRLALATALAPALACCEELRRRLSAAPQAKTSFELSTWQSFAAFAIAAKGGEAGDVPAPPSCLRNERLAMGRAQLESVIAKEMKAPSIVAAEVLRRGCTAIIAAAVAELEAADDDDEDAAPSKMAIPLEVIVEGGFGRSPAVIAGIEKAVRATVAEVNGGLSMGELDVVLLSIPQGGSLLRVAPMGTDPSAIAAYGAALQAACNAAAHELIGETAGVELPAAVASGATAARSIAVVLAPGGTLQLVAAPDTPKPLPEPEAEEDEDEEESDAVRAQVEIVLRRWSALPAKASREFTLAPAEGADAAAVAELELQVVEIERAAAGLENQLTRTVEIGSGADPDEMPEARVLARIPLVLPSGAAHDSLTLKATVQLSPTGVLRVQACIAGAAGVAVEAEVEVAPSTVEEEYWFFDAEVDSDEEGDGVGDDEDGLDMDVEIDMDDGDEEVGDID